MIRLLIADDEKFIRETMCSIIDWESMGVKVVAVCKDGLEAYDAILDEYPDIVLTDIKMPRLSGIELIQKITQIHDRIQYIILSGYGEFSYAREALRYGIKHYILKPCNEKEIVDAVKDCIMQIKEQDSRRQLQETVTNLQEKVSRYEHILLSRESGNTAPHDQPSLPETEKYKPFIQQILTYTETHLCDPNLTLKWISENQLYMNVDYVSRQFVLQTGTKFSAYLNNLRIKKAKELLSHCDSRKIYCVAEAVGCGNNPQYFSHLFKKYTQMTPKEYIQSVMGNRSVPDMDAEAKPNR